MIKKRHIVLTVVLTALVTMILYNSFILGVVVKKAIPYDSVAAAKQIIISEYVNQLTDEEIRKLDDAAIDAMVRQLGDPYSRYMSASAFEEYNEENEEDCGLCTACLHGDLPAASGAIYPCCGGDPAVRTGHGRH